MALLPCYNHTFVGDQYLRRCESHFHAYAEIYEEMRLKGVDGPWTLLRCDPDGSYGPVQCTASNECGCRTKYNTYTSANPVSLTDGYTEDDACQGARDKWLYNELQISWPISLELGRYEDIQANG